MNVRLPNLLNSSILAKYTEPGEPVYVIKASLVGDVSPYEHQDDHGRLYIFRWDVKEGGHILRVPKSVWEANKSAMAHSLQEQKGSRVPIVFVRSEIQSLGGEEVTRLAHTQKITGSIPVPATKVTDADIEAMVAARDPGSLAPSSIVVDDDVVESGELGGQFLHEGIAALVQEKAYRVPELAEATGATEAEVRAAIAFESSGLHVAAGGWVKLKS